MKEVDVFIRQQAIALEFECPECNHDNSISITDGNDWHDIWEHSYGSVVCSECESEYEIDNIEV